MTGTSGEIPLGLSWPQLPREPAGAIVDDLQQGWLLQGPLGVGKSTIAAQAGRELAARGHRIAWVRGDHALRQVPFGCLAPVLATLPADADELGAAVRVRRLLGSLGADATLIVDDGPLIDDLSASVLAEAAASGDGPRLIVTARTGHAVPDPFGRLLATGPLRAWDVHPLDGHEHDDLLGRALDGPIHRGLSHVLFSRSRGLPLLLRLQLEAGVRARSFERIDGVWQLTRDLVVPHALSDLIAVEVAALGPSAAVLVERIAAFGPLPTALVADGAALAELERAGFVTSLPDDRGNLLIGVSQPIVADAVRSQMGRRRLTAHVAWLGQHPDLTDDLHIRLVRTNLDLGADVATDDLERAASAAYRMAQVDLAARCARLAFDRTGDVEIGQSLVRILLRASRYAEGAALLEELRDRHGHDGRLMANSAQLHMGMGQGDHARREVDAALGGGEELGGQSLTRAAQASVLLAQGRPIEAIAATSAAGDDGGAGGVYVTIVRGAAQLWHGLFDLAIASLEEASASAHVAGTDADDVTVDAQIAAILVGLARAERGDATGLDDLEELWARSQGADAGPGGPHRWMAPGALGRSALCLGRPQTAAGWLALADRAEAPAPPVVEVWLEGMRAHALALCGEEAAATAILDGLTQEPPFPDDGATRARAHLLAMQGRRREAVRVLREAADDAESRGLHMLEAWLRYDQIRMGAHNPGTVARLAELATAGGPLPRLRSQHAVALRNGDGDELREISGLLAELGAPLFAVEALAQAVAVAERQGRRRDAIRWRREVDDLVTAAEPFHTPALADLTRPADLTPRELEIARLAAEGRSAKAIAAHLGISWRTVDNNLSRVYTKLAIPGREDLADHLPA